MTVNIYSKKTLSPKLRTIFKKEHYSNRHIFPFKWVKNVTLTSLYFQYSSTSLMVGEASTVKTKENSSLQTIKCSNVTFPMLEVCCVTGSLWESLVVFTRQQVFRRNDGNRQKSSRKIWETLTDMDKMMAHGALNI